MTDDQFKQALRIQTELRRAQDELATVLQTEVLTDLPTFLSDATRRRVREAIIEDLRFQLTDLQRQWDAL